MNGTSYEVWGLGHCWDSGLNREQAEAVMLFLEEMCPTIGFDIVEVTRRCVNEEVLAA